MRDSLTILAAAVLAALAALWIAPTYVDWRDWRAAIDEALSDAAGMPVTSAGPIGLQLLPTPRLAVSNVMVGDQQASNLHADALTLDLALMPLLRGQIQLRSTRLEGVEILARMNRDGSLVLPISARPAKPAAFDAIEIMRARLTLVADDRPVAVLAPLALEASSPARTGPWRINAEIAGRSLRITTGEATNNTVRMRVSLTPDGTPGLDTDGQLGFANGQLTYAGTWQIRPPGEQTPAGSATGRFALDPSQLALTEMALEWGPDETLPIANRITGEVILPLDTSRRGSLTLAMRRLDLGPLRQPVLPPQLRWLRQLPSGLAPVAVSLAADQLVIGGEEIARVALQGQLAGGSLAIDRVSGRLAGLEMTASGRVGRDGITLDASLSASETARLALALSRLGLEAALADLVGAQGESRATGRMTVDADGLVLSGWRGASGGTQWTLDASHRNSGTTLRLTGDQFRLDALPGLSMAGPTGDLTAELNLTNARIGSSSGEVRAQIRRSGATLKVAHLAASGFGGLALSGQGEMGSPGATLDLKLDAPQAAPALTLMAPLLPQALAQRLLVQARLLSPLAMSARVTETPEGRALAAGGLSGAMRVELAGTAARDMSVRQIRLALDNASSNVIAALIGAPQPQRLTEAMRLTAERDGNALLVRAMAPGLSLTLQGAWEADAPATRFGVTMTADGAARLLPAPLAGMIDPGPVSGSARLSRDGDSWQVTAITPTGGDGSIGTVSYGENRHISGTLRLAGLDLQRLVAAALDAETLQDARGWSTQRFRDSITPYSADLSVSTPRLRFAATSQGQDARLRLRLSPDETRLDDIAIQSGSGQIAGSARMARSGGLGSLSADLTFREVNVAALTGGTLSGKLSGTMLAGGAGETPARLVASLGGQGQLPATALVLAGTAPDALTRTLAADPDDLIDQARLNRVLAGTLASDSLTLVLPAMPVTVNAGIARMTAPGLATRTSIIDASAQIDLRNQTLDARLRLALAERPKGWAGPLPQMAILWRGPITAPTRQIDSASLLNILAQRRLQQEMDRVEAFEADARERAFFARRLRVEREMSARPEPVPEQPVFAPGLLPELPAPLQITPMPLPLSRQPVRP